MEPSDFIRHLVHTMKQLGVRYLITGSTASISYGEPRLTNDVDVVVEIAEIHISMLIDAFPAPEYYLSRDAARDAVRRRFQFNVLHPSSGFKIDFIVAADSEFDRTRLSRGFSFEIVPGAVATLASPEDVILKKLQYYQEGGSEKHVRDIVGILKVQAGRIDRAYLADWIVRLGVKDAWSVLIAHSPELA